MYRRRHGASAVSQIHGSRAYLGVDVDVALVLYKRGASPLKASEVCLVHQFIKTIRHYQASIAKINTEDTPTPNRQDTNTTTLLKPIHHQHVQPSHSQAQQLFFFAAVGG